MISKEINRLRSKQRYWKRKLISLMDEMMPGGLSYTYRKCGNPKCKKCRVRGELHGPHLFVTYKDEATGKTGGFYVPKSEEKVIENAHKTWKDAREMLKKIGKINREMLRLRLKERSKRK
jgi:hypothetical protein